MKKTKKIFILVAMSSILAANFAQADYIDHIVNPRELGSYQFSGGNFPSEPGAVTGWNNNSYEMIYVNPSSTNGSYMTVTVNGTLLGDNTYATSNPGVGIQYRVRLNYADNVSPVYSETSPDYKITLTGPVASGHAASPYFYVYYRLIWLPGKIVAPGNITSAPSVTAHFYNVNGDGPASISQVIYGGSVASQPKMNQCTISAPTEIKLSPLYGNAIQNGAQNILQAPTITLTKCPGAINGISYNFSAVYGMHDAANGVLDTVSGEGYAKNVYVQIQNADGTPHTLNTDIPLSNYTGSGDYTLPDFKVGYFVDDASSITVGNVKTAIELKVTYN
ncbi:fimbrial protein [Citrobacter portucalensis]|uniref:fimbrial protein n=1 Tax=Citrobacter portucalensis TaxID=1639133 RepID=UPI003BF5E2D2